MGKRLRARTVGVEMSLPGIDGDRITRIPTSGKEVRSHGKTIEVSAGVDGPGRAAGVGVGPAGGAGRARSGIGHEALRKRVRQAEADGGLRPDLPSSEEREEIKRLKRENYELRRANEILKAASVFFATELDADRPK